MESWGGGKSRSFLLEEEHSKEGHEDHHAVGEQVGVSTVINGSEGSGMSKINAHLPALSLLFVLVVSGGLLLPGSLSDTIVLHLVVFFVVVEDSLLLVLHHHADLEHTLLETLDGDFGHIVTIDELKLHDLLGHSIIELPIIVLGGSLRSVFSSGNSGESGSVSS